MCKTVIGRLQQQNDEREIRESRGERSPMLINKKFSININIHIIMLCSRFSLMLGIEKLEILRPIHGLDVACSSTPSNSLEQIQGIYSCSSAGAAAETSKSLWLQSPLRASFKEDACAKYMMFLRNSIAVIKLLYVSQAYIIYTQFQSRFYHIPTVNYNDLIYPLCTHCVIMQAFKSSHLFNNILQGSMHGFKGLISRPVLADEAFQPIHKKAEDHRRAAQLCIDLFQQINKFFESFSAAVEKCAQDCDVDNVKASYYCLIGFVCTKLLIENKVLTENTKGSSKQLTKACNNILEDFSKFLQAFQGDLRKYQEYELIIQEMCKKYYRSHKNLLSSIEAYKNSLTDVTLIYNEDQKFKRYQNCQNNYKIVQSEYSAITEKSQTLNERKAKIVKNWDELKSQFTKIIKKIGTKVIEETKSFVSYYCATNKNIVTFLAQQKYNLGKEKLDPFLRDIEDPSRKEIFSNSEIVENRGKSIIPLIFEYPQLIKQQFLETYNIELLNYLKVVEQAVEKRKSENKRIFDLFQQYFKIIERIHIIGVKQIISNFNKLKPKLVEAFGPRLASFLKIITTIFQQLGGINEKLVKTINEKIAFVFGLLNQESKLLRLFYEELKTNIEKFIGKKELKKIKEDEFTEETTVINLVNYRKEVCKKAEFFKHLIKGFQDKMSKNCEKISNGYTNLIDELNQSINQFYSLCCEHQEYYFGEQFKNRFQLFEKDVEDLVEKNKGFFQQLVLSGLKGDTVKIVFDGQINKTQEFKKLKKPTPIEGLSAPVEKQLEKKQQRQSRQLQVRSLGSVNSEEKQPQSSPQKDLGKLSNSGNIEKGIRKFSSSESMGATDEKQTKNLQFLLTKITVKENEQFIKSFSCALSQKIVLQGRIYITTQRICFSSTFNSNTIFFGKTFIQFPKEDIVKVEKRMNAIFLDNSISFTTSKGQLFFTSFFSRNEAYDLICRTFGMSLDQHVYEFDQSQLKQEPELMTVQVQQDDDIKDEEIQQRGLKIDALLQQFAYSEVAKGQILKQGLMALQFFRIFYTDNQMVISRRKYPSFLVYLKQLISHKEVQIGPWQPSIESSLNKSNIKSTTELKLTRKILAVVPVANSGVPFMPKTAKSEQIQSVYFYSKHKWVLESQISTSGAPYTDTFKVQLRTSVKSDQTGKCEISMGVFINFVKSTMMKSVIQSKSTEESTKAAKIWVDETRKYFLNLIKIESMASGKKTQNPLDEIKEQLQLKTNELQESEKQKNSLQKEIQELKITKTKYQKLIMGLSGTIVFLLLLLILF